MFTLIILTLFWLFTALAYLVYNKIKNRDKEDILTGNINVTNVENYIGDLFPFVCPDKTVEY